MMMMNNILEEKGFIFKMDGNQVCCHDKEFIDLQESIAGFGNTEIEALADYTINLKNDKSTGIKCPYTKQSINEGDIVYASHDDGEHKCKLLWSDSECKYLLEVIESDEGKYKVGEMLDFVPKYYCYYKYDRNKPD